MNKTLIDKLYNSCLALSQKATKGMNQILQRNLIKPINPNGIISDTNISVTKTNDIITIETHFPSYGYFVEYGRSAGKQPPIKPIKEWCMIKNLPDGVEWAIQKNIGKKGTKPKHFLQPLQRMLEMLQKTMKTQCTVHYMADYKNTIYENTEMLRDLKLKV